MQRFHVKSIILGIGIGIVLTSLISLIYVAGADPTARLSEADVVRLAEKYGMVKSASLLNIEQTEIKIVIETSDTVASIGEKLLNAALISDKAQFEAEMENANNLNKLVPGEYKIKKGTGIKDIIKAITAQK